MAPSRVGVGASSTFIATQPSAKPRGVQKHKNHRSSTPRYTKPRKTHPKVLGPMSPSDEVKARKRSSLLSMPPEIRLMIWEFALTSRDGFLNFDYATRRFDSSMIAAGLFTTCHSVALETLYLPITLNTLLFNVKDDPNNFRNSLEFMYRINQVERKKGMVFKIKGLKLHTDA